MSKKFADNLKQMRASKISGINPDSTWVARNRALLLSQISEPAKTAQNEPATEKSMFIENLSKAMQIFVSKKVLRFARASLTMFLAISVTVGGWTATVSAANSSLPGEALYNVKMASEGTELLVNKMLGTEEDKVTTILKHASNRVDEFQRSKSSEQANMAIQSLKKKIESTGESLEKAGQKSPEEAMAIAKVIEEKTEIILTSLATNKTEINETSTNVDTANRLVESHDALKAEVVIAENLIQATSIKAVEVLIQNVEQQKIGEEVITKEDVKQTIARKLDQLVSGMSKLDVEIGVVSSSTIQFDIASSTISTVLDTAVKENKTTEVSTSTTQVVTEAKTGTETVADAKAKVEVATQKVDEASKKAEVAVTEVGALIGQNNLSAALEKVKELGGVKQEATAIVLEATNAVSNAIDVQQKENVVIVPVQMTTVTTTLSQIISSTTNEILNSVVGNSTSTKTISTPSSTSAVVDKVGSR